MVFIRVVACSLVEHYITDTRKKVVVASLWKKLGLETLGDASLFAPISPPFSVPLSASAPFLSSPFDFVLLNEFVANSPFSIIQVPKR